MIWTIIISFFGGFVFGFFVCALLSANRSDD